MGFRAWIGLWTALILMIIVVTDCSALVKYITRFTGNFNLQSKAQKMSVIYILEIYMINRGKFRHSHRVHIHQRVSAEAARNKKIERV